MDDYISREETIKAFCEKCKGYYDGHCIHRGECDIDVIQNAPSCVPQWISVKDKLPETIDDVIVCNEDGMVYSAWYSDTWIYAFTDEIVTHKITHWMPFPKPPESEDAE